MSKFSKFITYDIELLFLEISRYHGMITSSVYLKVVANVNTTGGGM